MNNITVSVILITYGHEKYIRQAIEGVLMQQCDFEYELIIANDCSPDQTDLIVREIMANDKRANRINYIKHEKNLGMMPNFIFALQQCNGEYIALCEGDDYWTDPLKLKKQIDFLEKKPEYILTFHEVAVLNTDGKLIEDRITKVPEENETIEIYARLGNYIHTPSVVFRNVIADFPPEFKESSIGDYFLFMLLAEQGKFKFLKEKMAVYREDVGVWSSKSSYYRNLNTALLYTYLYEYFYKKGNNLLAQIFIERIQKFVDKYGSQITKEDLLKLSSNEIIQTFILDSLLKKVKILNATSIENKASKELLKIIFLRFKKRIWEK